MLKKGLTLLTICILIPAALIFSGCRAHSPQAKADFIVDYIAETLDLNDQQRAQLEGIKEELLAKAQEMHVGKEAMRAELMDELRKEEIDQQRIKALISQKQAQMADLMDQAVARLAEFHRTLTPDQKEKLVTKLEWFHKQHDHSWE